MPVVDSYWNGRRRGQELVHLDGEEHFRAGTEESAFGRMRSGSLLSLGCAGLDFGFESHSSYDSVKELSSYQSGLDKACPEGSNS